MSVDRSAHPCFNKGAARHAGRIHLPVAPKCNVQCNFCNRLFDCAAENRPGVTSTNLSPSQAIEYLGKALEIEPDIKVVGIAGPGDPFANPVETMETLRLIRERHPEIILCLSSNGLGIEPYLDELAALDVSHITITVTAIDPEVAGRIYRWVRFNRRVYHGTAAGELMVNKQLAAVRRIRELGMICKVNFVLIPGINEDQALAVAEATQEAGADVFNCMPYYPVKGSAFEDLPEPDPQTVIRIRTAAGKVLPQMGHCQRCRADAAGKLGAPNSAALMEALQSVTREANWNRSRPYIAVASREGVLVNQHLGEAEHIQIYQARAEGNLYIGARPAPEPGGGNERWDELAALLGDCGALLVSGVGPKPKQVLLDAGIPTHIVEGPIDSALNELLERGDLTRIVRREVSACGTGCGGSGEGCG
ncbi:MAG: radical SAM protein [Spirochaetaceae bacterium]|nr:MAG: radical SAM protein [Spirochaetaceae bacterium]